MVSTCAWACDEHVCWKVLAQGCWLQVSWVCSSLQRKTSTQGVATQCKNSCTSPHHGPPKVHVPVSHLWPWPTAPAQRGAGQWRFSRSPSQLLGTRWARVMPPRSALTSMGTCYTTWGSCWWRDFHKWLKGAGKMSGSAVRVLGHTCPGPYCPDILLCPNSNATSWLDPVVSPSWAAAVLCSFSLFLYSSRNWPQAIAAPCSSLLSSAVNSKAPFPELATGPHLSRFCPSVDILDRTSRALPTSTPSQWNIANSGMHR